MFKRFAIVAILLAAAASRVDAGSQGPQTPVRADISSGRSVQIDPVRKAWFDRAIADILEGTVTHTNPTVAHPQ